MVEINKFIVGPLETNCYLIYSVSSKAGFLIDPGFFDKRISRSIEKNGIKIKYIINTHGHFDHTSGNRAFGYSVLLHKKDGGKLNDGDIIKDGDISLEVIHTPGHTPGSICLKLISPAGRNILFTGDTLFRECVGRTDLGGVSEKSLLDSIKLRLMNLDDDYEVLPGHGPDSTIGWERANNPFLAQA